MTSPKPGRGPFGFFRRQSIDSLTPSQIADIVPDSDPRLRRRLERDTHSTLVNFLLFAGPNSH